MSVTVRAGTMFGLSDQTSRGSSDIGVLVGTSKAPRTVVEFSFELKLGPKSELDTEFAVKRLKQLRDVYSESEIVGIYQRITLKSIGITDLVLVISQLWSIIVSHHDATTLDQFIFLLASAEEKPLALKAYMMENGSVMVNEELDVQIVPNAIEQIVTSTIMNNFNYSQVSSSSSLSMDSVKTQIKAKEGIINLSLNELEVKIESILNYLKSVSPPSTLKEAELQGKITTLVAHLCEKLDVDPNHDLLDEEEQDDRENLMISKLALLNSQVAALAKLKEDSSRKVLKYGLLAQHYQV